MGKRTIAFGTVDVRVIPEDWRAVSIAAQLMADGADWACLAEVWNPQTFLDHAGTKVAVEGRLALLLDELSEANGGSLSGLPDVIGERGNTVVLREAKRRRTRDKPNPRQERFVESVTANLCRPLDVAVVEWD